MKNQIQIVRESYLGGCFISDCLPTTYDDIIMMISQKISVVSACFL